jgi:sugar-specific transcriptional regulator TrmB
MSSSFDFKQIGLTTRDKRVYEALVTTPRSSLRKVAVDTGINRGSVYESVKALAAEGLVGSIEIGKQRRYTASSPQSIVELIREKRQKLDGAEQSAEDYIRSLTITTTSSEAVPFATFYEDTEGVAAVLRDVLATCRGGRNGSAYRVISTKQVREFMYENFRNFTQRRIAEGIEVRVIAVGQGGSNDKLSQRHWLESSRGDAPNCYTIIYGNKTAFITLNASNLLSTIVIDNPGTTHLQKELFDYMWNSLTH